MDSIFGLSFLNSRNALRLVMVCERLTCHMKIRSTLTALRVQS